MRGVPAVLKVRALGRRAATASALLQATSLPFIVAAAQIGQELGRISAVTGAAMVSAGLLSVLIFPAAALALLRERTGRDAATPPAAPSPQPRTAVTM